MTRKLYWEDAYLKEFEARVVSVKENTVVLDRTAFYPFGGGQQSDNGELVINGIRYEVTDVKKEGDDVVHLLSQPVSANVGDKAQCKINWERRYALMRYHTAFHVLGTLVNKDYNGETTGGQIYPDRAHMDFDCPALNKELSLTVVEKANEIAARELDVTSRFITGEEASRMPELARTEPGKELLLKLDKVRIVAIGDFDLQADGGTHVANTREIGKIRLNKFDNKGQHRKRIEIILE